MIADARSASDQTAECASLPPADPTGGGSELNGDIGSQRRWASPATAARTGLWALTKARHGRSTRRAVRSAASSTLSASPSTIEVRGAGPGGRFRDFGGLDPLDLFRYSAPNGRALSPGNRQYFSINGGATNLDTSSGTGGGDLGTGWLPGSRVQRRGAPGLMLPISAASVTELDVLSYNLARPAKRPDTERQRRNRLADRRPDPAVPSRARRRCSPRHSPPSALCAAAAWADRLEQARSGSDCPLTPRRVGSATPRQLYVRGAARNYQPDGTFSNASADGRGRIPR